MSDLYKVREILGLPTPEEERRLKAAALDRAERKRSDSLMYRVTLFGVIVTLLVGTAGFWAAWEARQTRINDERPFIGFDAVNRETNGAMLDGEKYNGMDDSPSITNSGKSPARNVQVFCYGGEPKTPEPTWNEISKHEKVENYAYLLPGHKNSVICDGASLTPLPTPAMVRIHYAGVIYYQDEDKRQYQTPFCEEVVIATMMGKVISTAGECVDKSAGLPEIH